MQKSQGAVLSALEQVRSFLDQSDPRLQPINATGARVVLDDVITKLQANAVDQDAHRSASKGATARKAAAQQSLLVHHMGAVAAAARLLTGSVPGMAAITPPPNTRSTPALLAAADRMVQAAEQNKGALLGVLRPDFLDQLKVVIQDMKDALASGRTSRTKRSAATAAVIAEARRGMKAVRLLDGLVRHALAGDVKLEREWKARRRIVVPTSTGVAAVIPAAPAPVAPIAP